MRRLIHTLFCFATFTGVCAQITADSAYNAFCQNILEEAIKAYPNMSEDTLNLMRIGFDCPYDREDFEAGFIDGQKQTTLKHLAEGEYSFCGKFAYEKYGIAFVELDYSTYSDAYIEGFNMAMNEKIEFILGYDANSVGVIDENCQAVFLELEKQLTERFMIKVSGRGYYIYRIDLTYFPVKNGFDVRIHDIGQTTSIEKLEKGILFANPALKESTTTVSITFTLREPELPDNRSFYWMHNRTLSFPVVIEPKFYK
ncbi:MAG: hypothetical protein ACK4K0_09585 [Flavobacteriales bacterium]